MINVFVGGTSQGPDSRKDLASILVNSHRSMPRLHLMCTVCWQSKDASWQ